MSPASYACRDGVLTCSAMAGDVLRMGNGAFGRICFHLKFRVDGRLSEGGKPPSINCTVRHLPQRRAYLFGLGISVSWLVLNECIIDQIDNLSGIKRWVVNVGSQDTMIQGVDTAGAAGTSGTDENGYRIQVQDARTEQESRNIQGTVELGGVETPQK